MKVLYSSADVRREVRQLFEKGRGRRVAIAAFVGETAETYLRRPRGIELYCWNAPGTNPVTILHLRDKLGVKCHFIDKLHMKVYFAEDVGCVITSANLSSYALAGGRLKEAGVLLDAGSVDVDRFLAKANAVKATDARIEELRRRVAKTKKTFGDRGKAVTFADWFDLPSKERAAERWRFCPYGWDGDLPLNNQGKVAGREQYGKREPSDIMECNGDLTSEDFALTVLVSEAGRFSHWHWMFVDDVFAYNRDERTDTDFSHQAVQWYSLSRYRPAPFRLDDAFKKAFRSVINEQPKRAAKAWLDTNRTSRLPVALLEQVAERYLEVTSKE